MREQTRFLILDPMREFTNPENPDKYIEGTHVDSWEALRESKDCRIVYSPLDLDSGEDTIEAVCTLAEGYRDITIGIDELDSYLGGSRVSCPSALYRCAMYGRHFNVSIIAIARRPMNLPINLTSQVSEVYTFQHTEPRDLEFFRKLAGEECVARVKALPQYEFECIEF